MSKQPSLMSSQKPEVVSRQEKTLEIIFNQGILPLYFHANAEVSVNVLKALYAAGVRAVEYTNRGKEALQNFKVLLAVRDVEFKEMQIGIGTIKNRIDAKSFIDAGADFVISPALVPEVAKETNRAEMLWIPGCMTITEIIAAENMGVKIVKLFPGSLLGPTFMSAIRDIFPDMHFMPTGGVDLNLDNMRAWFQAGVSVVGLGSRLLSKELLEQKNYEAIKESAREALSIVQWIKN